MRVGRLLRIALSSLVRCPKLPHDGGGGAWTGWNDLAVFWWKGKGLGRRAQWTGDLSDRGRRCRDRGTSTI